MPKVRLTPTRLAVLRHAAQKDGQVWQTLSGTYSWDAVVGKQVTRGVNLLETHRPPLLVRGQYWSAGQEFEMVPTDLGREVLAEYDKEG